MPPSDLERLNIVQPAQHSNNSHDLLFSQAYPDLAAQLDLWKNLPSINSNEPIAQRHETLENAAKSITEEEEEEARSPVSGEKAVHDGHVNVVTPANVPVTPDSNNSVAAQSASIFDIDSLLNSLGIDAVAAHTSQLQREPATIIITPSLTRLLVLPPSNNPAFGVGLPHYIVGAAAPLSFSRPTSIPSSEPNVPTAKRARTRRVSVTRTESPNSREEGLPPNLNLSPAKDSDKRRRNTAASARFRLKKKEREAALEGKVKELKTKMNELENECEDLQRENGWLRGLIIDVTGSPQGPTSTDLTVSSHPPLSTESKRRSERCS
jgi:uncharacterized protein YhaN